MKLTPRLLSPLFVIALASAALAQADKPAEGREGRRQAQNPEQRLERMKESLTLTEEQVGKIKPILERDAAKQKELREDKALSQDDRRSKMRDVNKTQMEEIRAILTPEQQAKMKEQMEQRRERGGERRGGAQN